MNLAARKMMRAITGVSLLLLTTVGAFGQTAAAPPSFEVASVKVSAPPPAGVMVINLGGGPGSSDPGRITYQGATLRMLIARAYNVKEYQVEGPQWLDSERYDIMATIPHGESSKEQVALMLQGLLAERFKLALHHESKPLAVYTLSVAKGGPKLKEVDPAVVAAASAAGRGGPLPPGSAPLPPPPPPPPGGPGIGGKGGPPSGAGFRFTMGMNNRRLTGSVTLARMCDMLSNFLDRPVIDLTELTGTYELDLAWTPDESERMGGKLSMGMAAAHAAMGAPPPPSATSTSDGKIAPDGASDPGLSLAQALQMNYGLKLEPKKNPADILVIDRAEKVPTEN
jgi:uncharacterized protein (TIGR03435 family)